MNPSNKKASIALIVLAVILVIISYYMIAFVMIIVAIIIWFRPNLKKVKLGKFVEKNPPKNYTYHSDEKEHFK